MATLQEKRDYCGSWFLSKYVLDTLVAVQSSTTVFLVTSNDLAIGLKKWKKEEEEGSKEEDRNREQEGPVPITAELFEREHFTKLKEVCPFVVKAVGHGNKVQLHSSSHSSESYPVVGLPFLVSADDLHGGDGSDQSLEVKFPREFLISQKQLRELGEAGGSSADAKKALEGYFTSVRSERSVLGLLDEKLSSYVKESKQYSSSVPGGGRRVEVMLRNRIPSKDYTSLLVVNRSSTNDARDSTATDDDLSQYFTNWTLMPYIRGCQLQKLFYSDQLHHTATSSKGVLPDVAPSGLSTSFIVDCVLKQLLVLLRFLHSSTLDEKDGLGWLSRHPEQRTSQQPKETRGGESTTSSASSSSSSPGHCLVYRDLKLSNVHIDPYGQVKLVDFATACIPGSISSTSSSHRNGITKHIIAPELFITDSDDDGRRKREEEGSGAAEEEKQADRSSLTPAVDFWSLGVLLHELIFKKPLFGGSFDLDASCLLSSARGQPDNNDNSLQNSAAKEFRYHHSIWSRLSDTTAGNSCDKKKTGGGEKKGEGLGKKKKNQRFHLLLHFMSLCLSESPQDRFSSGTDWNGCMGHPVFFLTESDVGGSSPASFFSSEKQEEEGEEGAPPTCWLRDWYPEAGPYSEEISDQLLGL